MVVEAHFVESDVKGARWKPADGYCGSTFRTKTGTLISRTGVESKSAGLNPGFYSNATLEWDMSANVARVIDVANWGGGSYSPNAVARVARLMLRRGDWQGRQLIRPQTVDLVLADAGMPTPRRMPPNGPFPRSGLAWSYS